MTTLEVFGAYFIGGLATAGLNGIHNHLYGWQYDDRETLAMIVAWPVFWPMVLYTLGKKAWIAVRRLT